MLIIAHRGASGHAPENTLAAMDLAVTQGACAIELDVQRVENTLVVLHDRWLHKTTSGQGLLSDLTLVQLQQLDAGKGERVPTLAQVLERVDGRCDLNIELKGWDTGDLLLPLLEQAVATGRWRWSQFLVSSFHHPLLEGLRQQRTDLAIGALVAGCPQDYAVPATRLGAQALNMDLDFAVPQLIRDARARGLQTLVYTVDQPRDMERLAELGVDGIFTNYPDRARQVLGGHTTAPGQCWRQP